MFLAVNFEVAFEEGERGFNRGCKPATTAGSRTPIVTHDEEWFHLYLLLFLEYTDPRFSLWRYSYHVSSEGSW